MASEDLENHTVNFYYIFSGVHFVSFLKDLSFRFLNFQPFNNKNVKSKEKDKFTFWIFLLTVGFDLIPLIHQ